VRRKLFTGALIILVLMSAAVGCWVMFISGYVLSLMLYFESTDRSSSWFIIALYSLLIGVGGSAYLGWRTYKKLSWRWFGVANDS
jgi:hypothetical protein